LNCSISLPSDELNESMPVDSQLLEQVPFAFHFVTAALQNRFPEKKESYVYRSLYPWRLPIGLQWWLQREFVKTERAKSLILVGPTRFGKALVLVFPDCAIQVNFSVI